MTAAVSPTASSPSRRRRTKGRHAAAKVPGSTNLGKQLKTRRKALDLTQKELGVLLGTPKKPVPLATISRWERGGTIEHPGMLFLALDSLERQHRTNGSGDANGR